MKFAPFVNIQCREGHDYNAAGSPKLKLRTGWGLTPFFLPNMPSSSMAAPLPRLRLPTLPPGQAGSV